MCACGLVNCNIAKYLGALYRMVIVAMRQNLDMHTRHPYHRLSVDKS